MAKLDIQNRTETEAKVKILAEKKDLEPILNNVLDTLRPRVKAAGFRPGKAPNNIVEREIGSTQVHGELIELAANKFYLQSIKDYDFTPLAAPHVEVTKFIPYAELEMVMTVEIMPPVKLPAYKKLKLKKDDVKIEAKEIDEVIEGLRIRSAKKTPVSRAAKKGDEVTIDFSGRQNDQDVAGASGKDYPLQLGSGRFVPGFEEALEGVKASEERKFKVTFPKDYVEARLRGSEVEFTVNAKQVNSLDLPAIDDKFAVKIGPFKTLAELRADIKKQIEAEKERATTDKLKNELVEKIVGQSQLTLPPKLMEMELKRLEAEAEPTQSLETAESKTQLSIEAQRRVKTALVLSAIAKAEDLTVAEAELNDQMQLLAQHYQDEQMQQKLAEPAARREIANRLLVDKTVAKLLEYVTE